MRLPLHVLASLVLALSLVVNCAFWGGVAASRTLGPVVPEGLRLQAPLAYTWLLLGEAVSGGLGLDASLAEFAESQLDDLGHIAENRALAGERALQARSAWLKLSHPLPLLMLPIALVLWWRRPRGLKTFGGGR